MYNISDSVVIRKLETRAVIKVILKYMKSSGYCITYILENISNHLTCLNL